MGLINLLFIDWNIEVLPENDVIGLCEERVWDLNWSLAQRIWKRNRFILGSWVSDINLSGIYETMKYFMNCWWMIAWM